MSFESKMKKHIQKVFDENVPNPYEKAKVKKPFAMRKMLVPLGVAALACSVVLAIVLPLTLGKNELGINNGEANLKPSDSPTSDNQGEKGESEPSQISNEESTGDKSIVYRLSLCAAPKATTISPVNSDFVEATATKTLMKLDDLFKDSSKKNYIASPASFLLGVSSLAAVSDGIDLSSYGLSNPLNETKMLLENWNCSISEFNSRIGMNEEVSRIDSGVLHQQVGAKFAFDEQKAVSVEDEYIATGTASVKAYRSQAQNYFSDNVRLKTSIPDLAVTNDGVVTYSALRFLDNANLGPTEQRMFTKGHDTLYVDACIYGGPETRLSPARSYNTEMYEDTNYVAFKREINNSSILFIVPKGNTTLEEITVSSAYESFINLRTNCLAYGFIPYFSISNIGLDVSSIVTKTFTGSEKPYSKILKDDTDGSDIKLKMIQNAYYGFEKDDDLHANDFSYNNTGVHSIDSAIELNVDRPFYAICLKDDFPMFVTKVTDPRS